MGPKKTLKRPAAAAPKKRPAAAAVDELPPKSPSVFNETDDEAEAERRIFANNFNNIFL